MSNLSTANNLILTHIREFGGVERVATGLKKTPFKFVADNWGEITPKTFVSLLENKYIKPAGTQTVLGLPRYYEVVR